MGAGSSDVAECCADDDGRSGRESRREEHQDRSHLRTRQSRASAEDNNKLSFTYCIYAMSTYSHLGRLDPTSATDDRQLLEAETL